MERLTEWEHLRRVNPYVWDALLAVAVFGVSLLLEVLFLSPNGECIDDSGHVVPCFRIDAWGRVLLAVACTPLIWRRRAPIATLAATGIVIVVLQIRDYSIDFAGMAFLIAVYSAAAHRGRLPVLTLALPIAITAGHPPDRPALPPLLVAAPRRCRIPRWVADAVRPLRVQPAAS